MTKPIEGRCALCGVRLLARDWQSHVASDEHQRRLKALPTMRPDGIAECVKCGVRYLSYLGDNIWHCKACGQLQREPDGQSLLERFLDRLGGIHP